MGNPNIPPFVIDDELTARNRQNGREGDYATRESLREAFIDQGLKDLAGKRVAFPINGEMQRGEVLELTRENCSIQDLSKRYPDGFAARAGMFALLPAISET